MLSLELEDPKDRKVAIISSALSLAVMLSLSYFVTFFVYPPIPKDVPPLNSDEVIEEFMLDNVVVESGGGGSGSGTPTNDKIDEPKPQTEKIVTSTNSNVKVNSGNSNNQTDLNSNNTSSTTQQSNNPFGTGGDGGGNGSVSGTGFGNDRGSSSGPVNGGNGNGEGRTRKNDPSVDHIETDHNVTIYLKMTINSEGQVVSANNLASKTTTTDQRIINQVITAVKSQVKYSKDPGAGLVSVFLTVKVNAK